MALEFLPLLFLSLAPGGIILLTAKIRMDIAEWLFLSAALSLGLLTLLLTLVQDFLPLTITTISASLVVLILSLLAWKPLLFRHSKGRFQLPKAQRHHLLLTIPALISVLSWSTAYTVQSIDMGWHAFWAQQVVSTGHLPNYYLIEPVDQASRFSFGPHLLLGVFSLIANKPPSAISWIPVSTFTTFSILGIYAVTNRISRAPHAGLLSATLYAASYVPGGFIQRGNFPDILGFFLLIAVVDLLLLNPPHWKTLALGTFLYVTMFAFHPYAVIVTTATIAFRGLVWVWRNKRTILSSLRKSEWLKPTTIEGALLGLISAPIIFPQLALFKSNSAAQIEGIYYSVPTIPDLASRIVSTMGIPLTILGVGGIALLLLPRQPYPNRVVPLAWLGVMGALVYGPILGIGLEPVRFLWRMVEPLCILGGIFLAYLVYKVRNEPVSLRVNLRFFENAPSPRRLLVAAVLLSLVFFPAIILARPSYSIPQPNFQPDITVAQWLAERGNLTGRVAVDAEADNAATWIMYCSNYPFVIYRVNFAANTAPSPYRQVFKDLQSLFDNPTYPSVPYYLQTYSIQYLVTAAPDKTLYQQSPYLRQVMTNGPVSVFETAIPITYNVPHPVAPTETSQCVENG